MFKETSENLKPPFGCNSLQELLTFAPCCVEYNDEIYCLHIYKGNHGFIVDYSCTKEGVFVTQHDIKFTRKIALFDTYRTDYDLFKALIQILELLVDNKNELKFIPRIHPFNINL